MGKAEAAEARGNDYLSLGVTPALGAFREWDLGRMRYARLGAPRAGWTGTASWPPPPSTTFTPLSSPLMGKGPGHGHGHQSAWSLVLALPDLNGSEHNLSGT